MIKIMNHDTPDSFVLATGICHTIRQFLEMSLEYLGIKYYWVDDDCFEADTNILISTTDKKHFRPAEVDILQGDPTRAREELGWTCKYDVHSLMRDMIDADMRRYCK